MKGGSFRNPVLYIPISYYVGHPHTSVEAKVHLVMDVSNSVATYRNMEGVFTTITRTNAAGSSTDHISVDLSNLKYEGYPH